MELENKNRFIYLFFLLLFGVTYSYGSYIAWQSDYKSVRKMASEEDKYILVLLVDKKSPEVNNLLQQSFMNQSYIKQINENFVSVMLSSNAKESYPIEMLYTQTYPALFFLSSDEIFLCDALKGKITPLQVKQKLDACH